MDTQESPNRDISHPESIEKGSDPKTVSTDPIGIRIGRDDSDIRAAICHAFEASLDCVFFDSGLFPHDIEFFGPGNGWHGSAYLLSNCAMQSPSGKLYTYFSLKYTFLCFLAKFELGALICGLSRDSDMFVVGRAIQGCGGSGILNGALTILVAAAPISR
ncbi:hypothetical protein EAF00_000149 [Botryotinia globosa]|nr:hypothetical protein EAF00_000149 [Botryotinia globosa]